MDLYALIKEEYNLLIEKVYQVSDDVDLIYDLYFRDDIIKVNKGIYNNIFKSGVSDSSIFKSEILKDAHTKNKANIYINNERVSNGYDFINKNIFFSVNHNAFNIVKDYPNIETAVNKTGYNQLYNEFSEKKIKSSIRHELTHYLDDTFTNLFKKRKIFKTVDDWKKYKEKNYEYFDKFEVNSVIGNIVELKRHISDDKWNNITFEDMLSLIPQLNVIKTTMKKIDFYKYSKWKKDIIIRMNREGLLGDKMKFN
jgi:hypothetical protein